MSKMNKIKKNVSDIIWKGRDFSPKYFSVPSFLNDQVLKGRIVT
ncbi:hypothetical protein B4100_2125 [Heyndrickxia coagulans]|nr:hypothetical protein B4100_2125 [Heyndrickxia coagulans]